jgi:hypothetical protein
MAILGESMGIKGRLEVTGYFFEGIDGSGS